MSSRVADHAAVRNPSSADEPFTGLNNATLGNLEALAVLHAVATCGSFTAAARWLGVSKAAVSARVAAFEKQTGVQLFNRTTRAVTPTDAGARLSEHAGRMLRVAVDGLDEIAGAAVTPAGLLRVTAPNAIGRQLVAPLIPAFLTRYPEVDLQLDLSDAIENLPSRAFDIAIRHTSEPPESHMAWSLRKVDWHLVASPAYLEREGEVLRPEELERRNCLFYPRAGRSSIWRMTRGDDEAAAVSVRGRFLANNSEVLREAVLAGLGIGLLPDFSIGAELRSGAVRPVLADWQVEGTFADRIVALRPWTARLSPATRAFVDHLRRALGPRAG